MSLLQQIIYNSIKRCIICVTLLLFSFFGFCQSSQNRDVDTIISKSDVIKKLNVNDFDRLLRKKTTKQLIDVRAPFEFDGGHLKKAQNISFRSSDFASRVSIFNINTPVFLYCLSGKRSAEAAEKMQQMGFKQVYVLEGGLLKWRAANKPEINEESNTPGPDEQKGMTITEFGKNIDTHDYVLVDFSAGWCRSCKRLTPMLESLAEKKKDKLRLLKIDADANPGLLHAKGISSIPSLELYKDGKLVWKHSGYIDEQTLLQEIKL